MRIQEAALDVTTTGRGPLFKLEHGRETASHLKLNSTPKLVTPDLDKQQDFNMQMLKLVFCLHIA